MKIYSMTATFGKLDHATLTLRPGLNLIEAPNEWGKSTWCAFLAAMLYGIDTRERSTAAALAVKERYAPWSGAPMQGRIDLCWKGRDITIERRTKGRAVFGDFRAYETVSGLAVPELTADNCGKQLLGVEKSVFLRTGFIRLNDMPVTQDEALRRRLNELVTTGDESGQSDDLAQKLRDLKNKVRANRANGLIPQALAQQAELEQKLQQLDALQLRSRQLRQRQEQVAAFTAQLHNHKNALAWNAARERTARTAAARARLADATAQAEALERICAQLPTEEQLMAQAAEVRQLQSRKDSLQLELAMLPPAPAAPDIAPCFREVTPEQVRADYDAFTALKADRKQPAWLLGLTALGAAVMIAALVLALLNRWIPAAACLAVGIVTAVLCLANYTGRSKRVLKAKAYLDRYHPYAPENWVSAAEEADSARLAYRSDLSRCEANRTQLQEALQQIMAQLSALPATDGHSAALQQRRALNDARREQQHLQNLVQTLESTGPLPEAPTGPDPLNYSEPETSRLLSDTEAEARQLHKNLGQLEGQMQALGSREDLEARLEAVQSRLAELERTYVALDLAQNTLARAATDLQRRFAPAIARKAQEYFADITGGRYDRLSLDNELGLHAAAAEEDTLTSSLWRSDGTVDQLYLSLRLAVADALTPEAPLVLDDALVRFDDARLNAALGLLRRSAETRQVILFTCQTREKQLSTDS